MNTENAEKERLLESRRYPYWIFCAGINFVRLLFLIAGVSVFCLLEAGVPRAEAREAAARGESLAKAEKILERVEAGLAKRKT